jgi:hypothetical protein
MCCCMRRGFYLADFVSLWVLYLYPVMFPKWGMYVHKLEFN